MSNSHLRLNLVEGVVTFQFTIEAAQQLQSELAALVQNLKVAATNASTSGGTRAAQQEPMEYQYTGDVFLELFCNPNIWPSPFSAKLLITVRDERIRLTTEAELTRIIEDVNQYLENG